MDKVLLKKAFREWKKEARADYARTSVDSLGDCSTCVNYELSEKYGADSKGIFLKHWLYGMNGGSPIEELDSCYVAHDITEEQGEKFIEIFSKYFNVLPKEYNPAKCFSLFDKKKDIYKVTWEQEDCMIFSEHYTNEEKANRWKETLESSGYKAKVEKIA